MLTTTEASKAIAESMAPFKAVDVALADAAGRILRVILRADLGKITIPTLVIGAQYDSMDPKHMEWMASAFPNGRYLYCPNGSHFALYDDQVPYFDGLIKFIRDVDVGR